MTGQPASPQPVTPPIRQTQPQGIAWREPALERETQVQAGFPERSHPIPNRTPQSISELWYALDKRLALMEEALRSHNQLHEAVNKLLDDHETRLRSSGAGALVAASVTSFLSVLAILKAFLK